MSLAQIQNPWLRRPIILLIPLLIVWGVGTRLIKVFVECLVDLTTEIPHATKALWVGEPKRRYN